MEKLKHILHSKSFMIAGIAALVLAVIGVSVLASTLISNTWTSPTVTVTTTTVTPANSPLVISSPDFTSNATINTGTAFTFDVNLNNPSPTGAPGYTGVVVDINIFNSATGSNISTSDLTLQYNTGTTAAPVRQTIPTTQGTNVLTATFGPSTGFPVGYQYNQTTQFQVIFNTPGIYYATAQAVTTG